MAVPDLAITHITVTMCIVGISVRCVSKHVAVQEAFGTVSSCLRLAACLGCSYHSSCSSCHLAVCCCGAGWLADKSGLALAGWLHLLAGWRLAGNLIIAK